MNLLFVCTANISRSFLAEKLCLHEIKVRDLEHVSVRSAGVYAAPGSGPDPEMLVFLKEKEIPVLVFESRRIGEEDIQWADRILVMEKAHAAEILARWPEAEGKLDLLGRYVSLDGSADDVVDPYGRSSYHYRLAQSQIQMAIKNFIASEI